MSKFWRKIQNHHLPHHSANNNTAISLKFCGTACLIRNGVIILAPLPHMIHVQYVQCTSCTCIYLYFSAPHIIHSALDCAHTCISVLCLCIIQHTHTFVLQWIVHRVAVICVMPWVSSHPFALGIL